ncbi:3374_t:CDS:2, partial [Entrophospora sp. SA101]
ILMFIVFAAKKSIILEAWKIIKGYKSITCSHSGEEIGSIGTSSINFRRSVVSENVSSFEDDKKSVKITLKEWFNNLYNKYLKRNDLASKNKFKELGNSISNNNNNNNHVGGHTTIVIGKTTDLSTITGRKGSISSGVGSGQALGYNSYNDNEERASRNIHNNNVNNSIKKPHSRDSSSRLSIKRNRRDKSSSDSLSLHMSTPEMARASFGLGNNSLSSVSSISTSNRRSDGSDDGDTNNLPSSSSSKQVSNTITIPDNDDDTKDLQIQDAEST